MKVDAQVDEARVRTFRTKQPICGEQARDRRAGHSECDKKEEPLPVVFLSKETLRPVTTTETTHPRMNILGVGVSAIDLPQAVGTIESWVAARSRNYVCTATVHGAAFDFHAGVKKQAPLWMRQTGLEWLFRLLSEPRRLWRRYLLGNPQFIFLMLLQTLRLKRHTTKSQGNLTSAD